MSVSPTTEIVPRLSLLAYAPKPHEAIVTDDLNPRQLPVHHSRSIAVDPAHLCAPRILAICCVCGTEYNLCDASGEDIDALLARAWRCSSACEVRP